MGKKIPSISVQELKERLVDKDFVLMDVREPEEFEICQIEGSILVPFSELEEHLSDFDREREYIVHCKSGNRSLKAAEVLKDKGFINLKNLEGGIMSWASLIEPKMERY